eukprot:scaffold1744_cov129-Isochrysis_galbana.AAC.11
MAAARGAARRTEGRRLACLEGGWAKRQTAKPIPTVPEQRSRWERRAVEAPDLTGGGGPPSLLSALRRLNTSSRANNELTSGWAARHRHIGHSGRACACACADGPAARPTSDKRRVSHLRIALAFALYFTGEPPSTCNLQLA